MAALFLCGLPELKHLDTPILCDSSYMFEAREFLRKKLIGKKVSGCLYSRSLTTSKNYRPIVLVVSCTTN